MSFDEIESRDAVAWLSLDLAATDALSSSLAVEHRAGVRSRTPVIRSDTMRLKELQQPIYGAS
jgi:hypothetical protein